MPRKTQVAMILIPALLLLGASAAVLSQPASGDTATASGSEQLVGVWAGRRDYGPEVAGALTLTRDSAGWTAEIAGYRLPVALDGGQLGFEVPGDGGRFHGRIHPAGGAVEGQWIQPGAVSAFGQRFSTPVRLEPVGPGRWRGMVQPLADRVHVFFVLRPAGDGKVRAFLRNPESNFGRFFDLSEVERDGDTVRFWGVRAGRPEAPRQVFMEGRYRSGLDRLSVFIEGLGGTYDLERLGDGSVSIFLPRAWAREPYRYRPPTPRPDGWRTGDLGRAGMAVAPIEALIQKIVSTPMDAVDAPAIDAVLIARRGELVLEEYFHGWGPDRPHDVRSASKSITTTLVGVAIRGGLLSLDSRLYDSMAHRGSRSEVEPRARGITLEHLITMSSGLACDDWDPASPGGEDRMQDQAEEPDWYRFTLDLPMAHPPGEHPAYCTGGMNLAGGMVVRAAGVPLTEYFHRHLAQPLDMGIYHTNLMPTGEAYAGGGLRITGRDLLKLGQLMLDDGVWNGRRILDPGWSAAATTVRNQLGNERLGTYGYGWWILDHQLGDRRWRSFYAGGNGGNVVMVVPELELVIAFLGSNYNQSIMHKSKLEYVPEYILRSVVEGEPPERSVAPR